MRAGNALTSSLVIGPMPLRPLTMPSQADATVLPRGDTMPRPVTTTLRLDKLEPPGFDGLCLEPGPPSVAGPAARRSSGLAATLVDVIDGLLDGRDLFRV